MDQTPELQVEQRCPYCYQYLLMGQDFSVVTTPKYKDWICHTECLTTESRSSTPESGSSTPESETN